jgi:hypothetical protein
VVELRGIEDRVRQCRLSQRFLLQVAIECNTNMK